MGSKMGSKTDHFGPQKVKVIVFFSCPYFVGPFASNPWLCRRISTPFGMLFVVVLRGWLGLRGDRGVNWVGFP